MQTKTLYVLVSTVSWRASCTALSGVVAVSSVASRSCHSSEAVCWSSTAEGLVVG